MPVDNSAAADASQRAGFVKHYIESNYIGTGGGTTFRITEWAPGHARSLSESSQRTKGQLTALAQFKGCQVGLRLLHEGDVGDEVFEVLRRG
jgi:hypothetical protein